MKPRNRQLLLQIVSYIGVFLVIALGLAEVIVERFVYPIQMTNQTWNNPDARARAAGVLLVSNLFFGTIALIATYKIVRWRTLPLKVRNRFKSIRNIRKQSLPTVEQSRLVSEFLIPKIILGFISFSLFLLLRVFFHVFADKTVFVVVMCLFPFSLIGVWIGTQFFLNAGVRHRTKTRHSQHVVNR